ncbi:MAG TPA: hypothetical protein VJL60_05415 [Gammaproteobacteria bacterium]|nr:hypothetical protein [Gammaproteobacteria bacterium]
MKKLAHAKLSQEEVIAVYNNEFNEELNAVVTNIRSIAKGNTAFANTWKEWLGIGAIATGVIVVNAIFATLSAFSVLSGFITLGVGIAVAIAGIVGGISFQRQRIQKNKEKYRHAEDFIDNELTHENVETLRASLQTQLYPVMKDSTSSKINSIVKAVMASLANLIINKQVTSFSDLNNNDFRFLLSTSMHKTPIVTMNTKIIQSLIAELPDTRDKTEVVDRMQNTSTSDGANSEVTVGRISLWADNNQGVTENKNETQRQFDNSMTLR